MSKESPAKVKCERINQIAIAVYDLELVAQNFWNILGIGPWEVYNWEETLVYNRMYGGKPAWSREKIALAQVGDVQLELVQPVDGPSLYRDWLEEHGEGLHHFNFFVDDWDSTVDNLANEGFLSLQSGMFGQHEMKNAYNYFNIPPLRAIWEPVYMGGEEIGAKPTLIPDTDKESPAKVKCKRINQIAIVVNDLEMVARNYWNILGIGPWEVYNWEEPLVYNRRYHGKPAWVREKIALAQVGGVQLELVQPVDGPSVYRDWLEEHGEGLHHMNFFVDDWDGTVEHLTNWGFSSIQSGLFGQRDLKNAYNYFDIPPLRTIWEPVYKGGEEIGAKPTMIP
ncbi:MAG TPA: hypothetical protein ENI15_13440 [Spirochaetes bacterium]|nr:hypothetical protein [Spirochaetota bacterium]